MSAEGIRPVEVYVCHPHEQGGDARCQFCRTVVDTHKNHFLNAGSFVCEVCAIPYLLADGIAHERRAP